MAENTGYSKYIANLATVKVPMGKIVTAELSDFRHQIAQNLSSASRNQGNLYLWVPPPLIY